MVGENTASERAARPGTGERLPLWLTDVEAEALLALSSSSPLCAGAVEPELFRRLGQFVCRFRPAAREHGVALLRWHWGRAKVRRRRTGTAV